MQQPDPRKQSPISFKIAETSILNCELQGKNSGQNGSVGGFERPLPGVHGDRSLNQTSNSADFGPVFFLALVSL